MLPLLLILADKKLIILSSELCRGFYLLCIQSEIKSSLCQSYVLGGGITYIDFFNLLRNTVLVLVSLHCYVVKRELCVNTKHSESLKKDE